MVKKRDQDPKPEPRILKKSPGDYQPTKAELEQKFDMPGADMETVRSAVFRPAGKIRKTDKNGTASS